MSLQPKPTLVDSFIFYNELDMLLFRLTELYESVDYFIIVEATHTFAGNKKELYFENNKKKYTKFLDKIVHIIVDDMPNNGNAWDNEFHQRRCIDRGIDKLKLNDDDMIMISDCDEIPDKKILMNINPINDCISFNMDLYYYNLQCKAAFKWMLPKLIKYQKYKSIKDPNKIRKFICEESIDGGWHFSYFGDISFIKNKIKNFSHQEYNKDSYLDDDKIKKQIETCDDLFFRNNFLKNINIKDNNYLPVNYKMLMNYKYTQSWFLESEIKKLLLNFVDKNSKNTILEIGCFEGLSAVFFADNLLDDPKSTLTCVDPFLTIVINDHKQFLTKGEEKNFDYNISICKNSDKISIKKITSDKFFIDNDKTFNFIYIDGSHECDFIKRDMENSFKVLENNGIMWMDDYGGGDGIQIRNTMNTFLQKYKGHYELIHKGYQLAIKKIKHL